MSQREDLANFDFYASEYFSKYQTWLKPQGNYGLAESMRQKKTGGVGQLEVADTNALANSSRPQSVSNRTGSAPELFSIGNPGEDDTILDDQVANDDFFKFDKKPSSKHSEDKNQTVDDQP